MTATPTRRAGTRFAPKPPWSDILLTLVVLIIGTCLIVGGIDFAGCGC